MFAFNSLAELQIIAKTQTPTNLSISSNLRENLAQNEMKCLRLMGSTTNNRRFYESLSSVTPHPQSRLIKTTFCFFSNLLLTRRFLSGATVKFFTPNDFTNYR